MCICTINSYVHINPNLYAHSKIINKNNDIYRYGSKCRKNIKKRFKINGLVEDHHIIPKQWKNHPTIIKYKYAIYKNDNLMMLPNTKGIKNLNTTKLLHSGGHTPYNYYVKSKLDNITNEKELFELIKFLKKNLRGNPNYIAWK
tara:strand:- start:33 stop:464 length:432 start_codon:yes stop_codon:yes gene_type:complete